MLDRNKDVRRRSHWLKHLAMLIFATLVLALVVEAVVVARAANPGPELRFLLSYRLPMLFYLLAIWTMYRAFGRIAVGQPFDRVFPPLLSRLGMALAGGAIVSVFVSPWLFRIFGFRHGSFAAFDPPAITVGLVGLLLMILSGLFSRAVAMRGELDEFM